MRRLLFVALLQVIAATCLAGCHATPEANALPMQAPRVVRSGTSPTPQRFAEVRVTLPVVALPSPAPTPWDNPNFPIYELSSTTRSIAGTFGSTAIEPVALAPTTRGCSPQSDGLHCRVFLRVPIGKNVLYLRTYASTDGTGPPLALAQSINAVTVRRKRTYAPFGMFVGLASSLAFAVSPTTLTQGTPANVSSVLTAFDASGAIIPSYDVEASDGHGLNVRLRYSGAYSGRAEGYMAPLQIVTFAYDGRLSGTQRFVARDSKGSVVGSQRVTIRAGSTAPGQLFVWNPGTSTVGTPPPSYLTQFDAAANGNVPPLRTYQLSAPVVRVNSDGSFWSGPLVSRFSTTTPARFEEFDTDGKRVGVVQLASPSAGGTFDAAQNAYIYEGSCPSRHYTLSILSAASGWKTLVRQINLHNFMKACGPTSIAVDASGDTFVPSEKGNILEYGSQESGDAPPARTLVIPGGVNYGGSEFALDTQGNLFAVSNSGALFEFAPDSNAPVALLPGVTMRGVAVDSQDDIYGAVFIGYGPSSVEEFQPGASVPVRTIGGSATALTQPLWLAVLP
jgi:hypothetical protein